jgi:hypothetical protein
MRQRLNLSQASLDELGTQANELGNWIEQQMEEPTTNKRVFIPPHLTLMASLTLLNGLSLFYEWMPPSGTACWDGGCIGG